jgi:hypothetical protein
VPKFKPKQQQNTTGAKNTAVGQQQMFKRIKTLRRVTLLLFKRRNYKPGWQNLG